MRLTGVPGGGVKRSDRAGPWRSEDVLAPEQSDEGAVEDLVDLVFPVAGGAEDEPHGDALPPLPRSGPRAVHERGTQGGVDTVDALREFREIQAREYADPLDRRFHAQPTACPVCGPQYRLQTDGEEWRGPAAVERTVRLLAGGKIVAVKGLGGYHLACDARDGGVGARVRPRRRDRR